jgi:hypothetical protein
MPKVSTKMIIRSPLPARGPIALLLEYRANISKERMTADRVVSLAG